jgi:hypothetical protein
MAYKVFTNGSVLNASEINDNLMRQSVMVFSNAAARTAAISSPVEGMLTYLEDVDRYEHWNSSAWVSPFGLTKITDASFSAQTSVSINNCFTSTYSNYKVLLDITTRVGNGAISLRFRAGGTDTSNNYNFGSVLPRTSGVSANSGNAGDNRMGIGFSNVSPTSYNLEIFNPQIATNTNVVIGGMGGDLSTWFSIAGGGNQNSNTVFDGLTIIADVGSITGNIRVYGYRN